MRDSQTYISDTDYFFLGNGHVVAVIQWSRNPSASPYGILLWDAERMTRKEGTWLYHPELGLSRTMLTVIVDGKRRKATHESLQAIWDLDSTPTVVVRWMAGTAKVIERFHIRAHTSELVRDVWISAPTPCEIAVEAALYANPLLFDQFGTRDNNALYANGYASVQLSSAPSGQPFERFLTVPCNTDDPTFTASLVYSLNTVDTDSRMAHLNMQKTYRREKWLPAPPLPPAVPLASDEPFGKEETSLADRIQKMYKISQVSLRAAVAHTGRFDASIWQYNFEWGMDAAMVATAAVCSGDYELARQVLENVLTKLSNETGMIAESGRFRSGELSELNGNGAVLDAIWHYCRWTGDYSLYNTHRQRITAIADYVLRKEFQHPSGLLCARRDLWERLPWMGVQPGFELSHQTFCCVGLQRIAEIAESMGNADDSERWRFAGERILHGMLHDPTFSMIENGHFIHRRLLDGSVQETMLANQTYRESQYAPYIPNFEGKEQGRPCEPDASEALPIIYGLVDPQSNLAISTLEHLESLWNPTECGGYARCNIHSDPDSPGPWAFPTAFIGAAEIESGLQERADRTMHWLLDMAGAGGSWFEYYGERATPPYPPIGIIVWGWAQFILLYIRNVLGIQLNGNTIRIRPRIAGITHRLHLGGHSIYITVCGLESARLDGKPIPIDRGAVHLLAPFQTDHRLDFLA